MQGSLGIDAKQFEVLRPRLAPRKGLTVLIQRHNGAAVVLDEDNLCRAAARGFQAKRTAASKQIEHP